MKRGGPLKRSTPLRRGGRLNPISIRRQDELDLYCRLREIFLAEHPFCQWWLAETGFTEAQAIAGKGVIIEAKDGAVHASMPKDFVGGRILYVPAAREIHHKAKRRGKMLNDTSFWMAVSVTGHDWIEQHKDEARRKGYLLNF
jgi:hypothetical protein